jgi:hypothetical protein
MAIKEYTLNKEQLTLITEASKDLQITAAVVENKRKAFSDLITMLCITAGFDPKLATVDPNSGKITQDVPD